jgi:hypothetical protein
MQKHDHEKKAPGVTEPAAARQASLRTDLAPAKAAKIEGAPLVDGPLYLRCFGDAPDAFVS